MRVVGDASLRAQCRGVSPTRICSWSRLQQLAFHTALGSNSVSRRDQGLSRPCLLVFMTQHSKCGTLFWIPVPDSKLTPNFFSSKSDFEPHRVRFAPNEQNIETLFDVKTTRNGKAWNQFWLKTTLNYAGFWTGSTPGKACETPADLGPAGQSTKTCVVVPEDCSRRAFTPMPRCLDLPNKKAESKDRCCSNYRDLSDQERQSITISGRLHDHVPPVPPPPLAHLPKTGPKVYVDKAKTETNLRTSRLKQARSGDLACAEECTYRGTCLISRGREKKSLLYCCYTPTSSCKRSLYRNIISLFSRAEISPRET